ncbi:cupin domain-containing protein [Nocardia panacis]|uniref:cupin domain-containing protein n=1 Tax=Nocardia panacis TaxID=2340916 RepID=UPI0011C3D8FB|nr:cupin domain-containing protein [Nocardia panacis]
MSAPIDMFESLIHLRDGGVIDATPRSGNRDAGLWTISAFHAQSNTSLHADHWERHPVGDELLLVLSGVLTVHLRHGDHPPTTLRPGAYYLVPAGAWHRLTVEEPGDLLSITPRVDTEHEPVSA